MMFVNIEEAREVSTEVREKQISADYEKLVEHINKEITKSALGGYFAATIDLLETRPTKEAIHKAVVALKKEGYHATHQVNSICISWERP